MRSRLLLCAVCLLLGCKTFDFGSGPAADPSYGKDAESNLRAGNEALEARSFQEAEKYFEYVRTKYPYLEAAKEAELRLADAQFERDQFVEARDKYQAFVKLHPLHPRADYAAFRAALTYVREIPTDLFFLPSSREKDQTDVRAANKAMAEFIRQYPKSSLLPEAQKYLEDTRRRMAEHELYVADFYAGRQRWAAAAGRWNKVLKEYSGLGYDKEVLFDLHRAYRELKDDGKAKQTLQEIISRFPDTPAARRASGLLGS